LKIKKVEIKKVLDNINSIFHIYRYKITVEKGGDASEKFSRGDFDFLMGKGYFPHIAHFTSMRNS